MTHSPTEVLFRSGAIESSDVGSTRNLIMIKHTLLALLLLPGIASAQGTLTVPAAQKLKVPALSAGVGYSVALSESYIVAGSPTTTVNGLSNAGDVLVFRASDGVFVKRLVSPSVRSGGRFGSGVAVYGGIAYIGAPGDEPSSSSTSSGAVYAFDIATGKKLWTALGGTGQKLGGALAIGGDRLAVGGPDGAFNAGPSASGSVVVLDRKTGVLKNAYALSGAVAGDRCGQSVALSGSVVLFGAPFRDHDGLSDAGMAYAIDLETNAALASIKSISAQAGAQFGAAVAITRDRLIVGSPLWNNGGSTQHGRADQFDMDGSLRDSTLNQGVAKQKGRSVAAAGNMILIGGVAAPAFTDGQAFLHDMYRDFNPAPVAPHTDAEGTNFGCAVAMNEQMLVVADDQQVISTTPTTTRGALWVVRFPRQSIKPEQRYGATNDPAPGIPSASYSSFADVTLLENNSSIMFRAGLKGSVTTANNSAIFNSYATNQPALILRKGEVVDGSPVTALSKTFFGVASGAWPIIQATRQSKLHIFRDDGMNTVLETAVGQAGSSGSGTIGTIRAMSSAPITGSAVFVYNAKSGINGINSTNDSRVARDLVSPGTHTDIIAEGGTSPDPSRKYGAISPRIASSSDYFVVHTALAGETATNSALILCKPGFSPTMIAQKGKQAAGTTLNFSTFLGEGINAAGSVVFRATLAGGSEGLWLKTLAGNASLIMKKGDPAAGTATGIKFVSVNRFFITLNDNVIFSARLTGAGVNTSNDQGIWLKRGSELRLLMREGEAARDCGSARIGTITGLEVGTDGGAYAITTSLTGSTAQNQAQFFGSLYENSVAGRMPKLTIRKGAWLEKAGGQRISSLVMGTHNISVGGSGSTGTVRLVSDSCAFLRLQYSDRIQEMLGIRP
jgi:outer membrane protein assembly factor BamB